MSATCQAPLSSLLGTTACLGDSCSFVSLSPEFGCSPVLQSQAPLPGYSLCSSGLSIGHLLGCSSIGLQCCSSHASPFTYPSISSWTPVNPRLTAAPWPLPQTCTFQPIIVTPDRHSPHKQFQTCQVCHEYRWSLPCLTKYQDCQSWWKVCCPDPSRALSVLAALHPLAAGSHAHA